MKEFSHKTNLLLLLSLVLILVNILTVFSEWETSGAENSLSKNSISIVLNLAWVEIGILLLNVIITSSIFFIIYLKIILPLRQAAIATQKAISIDEVLERHKINLDDVSYLKNAVEILCEREMQNQWQNNGFVQLSSILNENYAVQQKLGENIISFLLNYLDANAGAMYLVSESKAEFIRIYATGYAQYPANRCSLSEGLLGSVYKQNQMFHITENIGKNHFVGTPFLKIQAKSLILLPLFHANKVQGVIELVFAMEVNKEKITLLKSLSPNLAANLAASKHDFRMRQMLEQSQDMSNTLQQQEEELRQNLEELQTNSDQIKEQMREMTLIKNELASRIELLDQTALLTESDIYGNIIYANEAFCKISQYTLQECVGKPHSLVRHPDTPKEVFEQMWKTIKSGKIFTATYKNKAKDGSSYWVEAYIAPVFDDNNQIIKYIGIRLNVTERVEREIQVQKLLQESQEQQTELQTKKEILKENIKELRASEEKTLQQVKLLEIAKNELKSRIDVLNSAAIVTESDLYGNIIYANQKFCEISKYTLEECIGKPHSILRHPDVPKEVFRQMWQTIKSGGIFKGILPNKNKYQEDYWVDATVAPVLDSKGIPIKYISVRFDITKQVNQAKQIETLLENALAGNKKLQEQEADLRKSNEQLEESSNLLEQANQTLEQKVLRRTAEISAQKEQIESSIRYAKRIQEAILPTLEEMHEELPNLFVLYLPKDIVSGDFYWFKKRKHQLFLAAVDCTGHGVPGAMLSMIGESILSYIVGELGIFAPQEILSLMHDLVKRQLKQNQYSKVRDGMDLGLCMLDTVKQELQFAGANNPLVYIQNEVLTVIKGDKLPIGGFQLQNERKFTLHSIDISQKTNFYLYTDGYADQFGGAEVKKFMSKNLHNLLLELHFLPADEQKNRLEENIKQWKLAGKSKQIDDITLIGAVWGK
ncbi:MAG: PAS domain S-box protein [Bacteroidetes bacterium]|nr:MAG: PAS domain S-box protein [Bacteroidota bacterium]